MATKDRTPLAADSAPRPAPVPQIDGGGDPEFVIYVERHDGLIPHLGRGAKSRIVFIGGVEHQHVSEHEGRWVYRAC